MMHWIAETLVATTLLMLLVLAIRPIVSNRFGARAAYLLWLAPALRMILPPLPADWFGDRGAAVQDVVVVLAGSSSPSFQPATTAGGGTAWLIVSLSVWLGGAALFFGRHWLSYLRFSRDVTGEGRALFDAGRIPVTASRAVSSPIALGVFGRAVIVPEDFEHRYDAAEQRLAVAHELTHHDRHDVPVNFAALAVLALHWWNPVAHIAHRAFRLDQEAACDAIVLSGASAEERHAYGSALFKSAMGSVPLAACAMGATTTLKVRLRRIVSAPAESRLARPGAALAAFLVLGGVIATASGGVRDAVDPVFNAPVALAANGVPGLTPINAHASPTAQADRGCPEEARRRAAQAAAKSQMAAVGAQVDAPPRLAEASQEANQALLDADAAMREAMAQARLARQQVMLEAQAAMERVSAETDDVLAESQRAVMPGRAEPISCSGRISGGLVSLNTVSDARGHKQIRVMLCGNGEAMTNVRVAEALRTARAQIEENDAIPDQTRDHVIAALDRQIEALAPASPSTTLQ